MALVCQPNPISAKNSAMADWTSARWDRLGKCEPPATTCNRAPGIVATTRRDISTVGKWSREPATTRTGQRMRAHSASHSSRAYVWRRPWPRISGNRPRIRPKKASRSPTMNEESSTDPPWIHTTAGRWGSPASRQCRRTPEGSTTSGSGGSPLETARHPRHRVRADPVHDGDEEVELEGADLSVVHDLGRFGEVHVADDRRERRVLEEHDHLRHQRRHHVAQGLGQDDVAHGLRAGEPQRARRLHLAARHGLNAGPHDLAEVGGLEDHERGERDPVLRQRQPEELRNDEPEPEDHHDQRDTSEELDVHHGRHANPGGVGEPGQADHDPQGEAEYDRRNGQAQRTAGEAADAEEALDDQELEVVDDDAEVEHRALSPARRHARW